MINMCIHLYIYIYIYIYIYNYMVNFHEYGTNPEIKVFTIYQYTVIGFSMFVVLCRCGLKRTTNGTLLLYACIEYYRF